LSTMPKVRNRITLSNKDSGLGCGRGARGRRSREAPSAEARGPEAPDWGRGADDCPSPPPPPPPRRRRRRRRLGEESGEVEGEDDMWFLRTVGWLGSAPPGGGSEGTRDGAPGPTGGAIRQRSLQAEAVPRGTQLPRFTIRRPGPGPGEQRAHGFEQRPPDPSDGRTPGSDLSRSDPKLFASLADRSTRRRRVWNRGKHRPKTLEPSAYVARRRTQAIRSKGFARRARTSATHDLRRADATFFWPDSFPRSSVERP
jgi:hypothetical protein